MSRQGVIFDVDGTLIDSNYLHTRAWARAFEEAGERVPTYRIHRAIGMGSQQLVKELTGRTVGVIVADTFGRAWRMGIANVALGVAGVPALIDYRGRPDDYGHELSATVVAVADELAGAAELVMGKTERVPVAIVRGYRPDEAPGTGRDLLRPPELDLFR